MPNDHCGSAEFRRHRRERARRAALPGRSGRDSTSRSGRTRTRSRAPSGDHSGWKIDSVGAAGDRSAARRARRRRRARRDRAWCRSTACWDDPTRARRARCPSGESRGDARRNRARARARARRRCRAGEIDRDDGVDRLAFAGVVLAHADPALAASGRSRRRRTATGGRARAARGVSGCGADRRPAPGDRGGRRRSWRNRRCRRRHVQAPPPYSCTRVRALSGAGVMSVDARIAVGAHHHVAAAAPAAALRASRSRPPSSRTSRQARSIARR